MNRLKNTLCCLCLHLASASPAPCRETVWQANDEAAWKALDQQQQDDALRLFTSALAEATNVGPSDYRVGVSQVGLAWVALNKREYDSACRLSEAALPLLAQIPNPDRKQSMLASAYHSNGRAKLCLGAWEPAREQLSLARAAFADKTSENERLVDVLVDLGRLDYCCRRLLSALQLYEEAQRKTRRSLVRADILLQQARILIELGRYSIAAPMYDQWRSAVTKSLPQRDGAGLAGLSPASAISPERCFEANLIFARLAILRGDLRRAEELLTCVASCHPTCTRPHCDCQTEYWLVWAQLHAERGKPDDWKEMQTALGKIQTSGWVEKQVKVIRHTLTGRMYFAESEYEKAEAELAQAIATSTRELGPDDPLACDACVNWARILIIRDGDAVEVNNLADHILRACARITQSAPPRKLATGDKSPPIPFNHPDIGRALQFLGNYHIAHQNYAVGQSLLVKSHQLLRLALPPTHPECESSLINLARAEWSQKHFEEANRLLNEAEETLPLAAECPEIFASFHAAKGWMEVSFGNSSQAIAILSCSCAEWDDAARLQRRATSHPGKEDALLGLAAALIGAKNDSLSPIEDPLREAEVIFERRRMHEWLPYEFTRRAALLQAHGRPLEAWRFYREAKTLYEQRGAAAHAATVQGYLDAVGQDTTLPAQRSTENLPRPRREDHSKTR